jgi:hypothetical protein
MWREDRNLKHTFDDPVLLSTWSKKHAYRYSEKLQPTERDFPEARARLAARQ